MIGNRCCWTFEVENLGYNSDECLFEVGTQQPEASNPETSVLFSLFNPPEPWPGGGGKGTDVEGPGTFQSPGKLDMGTERPQSWE